METAGIKELFFLLSLIIIFISLLLFLSPFIVTLVVLRFGKNRKWRGARAIHTIIILSFVFWLVAFVRTIALRDESGISAYPVFVFFLIFFCGFLLYRISALQKIYKAFPVQLLLFLSTVFIFWFLGTHLYYFLSLISSSGPVISLLDVHYLAKINYSFWQTYLSIGIVLTIGTLGFILSSFIYPLMEKRVVRYSFFSIIIAIGFITNALQ